MLISELLARVEGLERLIREHRDAQNQERCFEIDRLLYADALPGEPLPDPPADASNPEKWHAGCEVYRLSQLPKRGAEVGP